MPGSIIILTTPVINIGHSHCIDVQVRMVTPSITVSEDAGTVMVCVMLSRAAVREVNVTVDGRSGTATGQLIN